MNDSLYIPPALVRMPVWTYTMLNTYRDICPHQAAERYVYKRVPFVETDAMRWGNAVHAAMEKRVGRGATLPAEMPWEPIAACFDGRSARVEMKMGVTRAGKACDFFDTDVWGRGKLDLQIVNGEKAYLLDWKSGKMREDSFELRVQAVFLHAKNPGLKKIAGQYGWLKDGKLGTMHDLSDTRATWNEISRLVALMEADLKSQQWEKISGPLCGWCPCKECEHNKSA